MAFPEALGATRALVIEAAVDATLPTLCGEPGGDGAGRTRCNTRRPLGLAGTAETIAIGASSLAAGVASSALVSGGCSPALVPGIGATALVSAVSVATA